MQQCHEYTYPRLTTALARLADGTGTSISAWQLSSTAIWPGSGPLSASVQATVTGQITRAGGSSCTACQHLKTVLHILGWDSMPGWSSRTPRTERHPDPRCQRFRPVMPGQPSTAARQVPTGVTAPQLSSKRVAGAAGR
jgi:hypothetical protein